MPAEPPPPDGLSPLATAALVAIGLALAGLGARLASRPAESVAALERLVPRGLRARPSGRALRVLIVEGWLLRVVGLLLVVIGAGLALARML